MWRRLVTYVVNKLKSKEAYLEGDGHMVLRVSWGPEEGAGSHAAGFRVPGAVGEGPIFTNPEIKYSLNYYTYQVLQLTRENVPSYIFSFILIYIITFFSLNFAYAAA